MCTSLSNEGCGSNFTTKLQPEACIYNNIIEWQRRNQQHKTLNPIAQFFEVDEILQHYQGAPQDMTCAKIILNSK